MLSASSSCGVALERHGAVAVIAFDRPDRRNAMDMSMREEFARMAAQSLADESLRAIVLTGRGGHFCAGGDIGSMGQSPEGLSAEVGRERMRSTLQSVSAL